MEEKLFTEKELQVANILLELSCWAPDPGLESSLPLTWGRKKRRSADLPRRLCDAEENARRPKVTLSPDTPLSYPPASSDSSDPKPKPKPKPTKRKPVKKTREELKEALDTAIQVHEVLKTEVNKVKQFRDQLLKENILLKNRRLELNSRSSTLADNVVSHHHLPRQPQMLDGHRPPLVLEHRTVVSSSGGASNINVSFAPTSSPFPQPMLPTNNQSPSCTAKALAALARQRRMSINRQKIHKN